MPINQEIKNGLKTLQFRRNNIEILNELYNKNESIKLHINRLKVPIEEPMYKPSIFNYFRNKIEDEKRRPLSINNQQRLYNLKELNNLNVNNINTLHNLYKTNRKVKKNVNEFIKVYGKPPYSKESWNKVSANFHQLKNYIKSTKPSIPLRRNENVGAARAAEVPTVRRAVQQRRNISYKHLFIFGHGITSTTNMFVLPNNINLKFYINKGLPLSGNIVRETVNRLSAIHSETFPFQNQPHLIKEKTALLNNYVHLRNFYKRNSVGHLVDMENDTNSLTGFSYSGITTSHKIVKFINIPDSFYESIGIRPYRNVHTETNSNGSKYYEDILDFGNNVYGTIGNMYINIINNMNPQYKEFYIEPIKRVKGISKVVFSNDFTPIFDKFILLSYYNHDSTIISLERIRARHYLLPLSELIHEIKRKYTTQNILVHAPICRPYMNNMENGSVLVNREPRNTRRLMRSNSFSNAYLTNFKNIFNKANSGLQRLNVSANIKSRIQEKYVSLLQKYRAGSQLNIYEIDFLVKLKKNNISEIRSALNKIE